MPEVVRLTVVPDAAQVVPGDRLSLALTVQNTGHSDAHYRLEVSGVPADWCDLDPPRVTLLPGASAQVLLSVHPPASTVAIAGRYTLTVQVRAEDDPASQVATVVALMVSTGGGLDMDVQPAEAVGRQGVFRITFLNQMNWPVYVALTARDNENGLRFSTEPDAPVIVPAGGGGLVEVHVVPKIRKMIGEPHPYEIEFRGSQLGTEQAATALLARPARFVYVPRYTARYLPVRLRGAPGWALLLPLVLLVLLLVVAGGRTLASPATRTAVTPTPPPTRVVSGAQPTRPRATVKGITMPISTPSVRRFTLMHRHRGQPYELVWQTSGAQHVTLVGRPVAARGHLVLPAPLHSATYRLAAGDGLRRATARLHVVVDATTTDAHAFVLTTPDIATFALRRRKDRLYVIWLVRNAVHVRLQGQSVARAGERLVPPRASTLRLTASNDVGSRQRLLHIARPMPAIARPMPATTPRPRPTMFPALRPTATLTRRPTMTPTAHPTGTPTPRPTATPTPYPTRTPTPRPTMTSPPIALSTTVPGFITTPPPFAAVTTTPTAPPVPSAILLNPEAVDFGRQHVGTTSAVHSVYVVNLSPARLTITGVAITGNDAGDFAEADTCADVAISTYGRCTISVRFTPLTKGVHSASLVISDTVAGGSQEVLLSGRGDGGRALP